MSHLKEGAAYLASLRALKKELARRGLFEPDVRGTCAELALHLTLAALGIALFMALESLIGRTIATILMTLGLLGVGTSSHNASHFATFRSRRLNRLCARGGFTLILGLAESFWRETHLLHHGNPNILGYDEDIDLMPVFAITERDRQGARGLARLFYNHQWFFLPLAMLLNAFNLQRQSLTLLVRRLLDRRQRRSCHIIDAGCLAAHLLLWLAVPAIFLPLKEVALFYVLRNLCLGVGLFVLLAPSHFPPEAACAVAHQKSADFELKQTAATVNFHANWYGRMLCSGLDSQIEHHLFPAVSHRRLPQIGELVQEYCTHCPIGSSAGGRRSESRWASSSSPSGWKPSSER